MPIALQSETQTAAVRIRGLSKRFASFQLGPLDLTVPTGAVYGLIGPNGAGKTTTLDLIMGMGAVEGGTIEVFGMDHTRDEVAIKRRVGYVSPELSFAAWGRIDKLFKFLKPYYPTWDDARALELLRRFDLLQDGTISTLSLGNRTRLALVAALAHKPDLLILDEPTTGLDPIGKHHFFEEMMALMQDEACSVLISSHNLVDLERYADHIGIIQKGRMLLETRVDQIADRYRIADVQLHNGSVLPARLKVLRREGPRARVLIDREAEPAVFGPGVEVIHESGITLEELFIALAGEDAAR